MDGVSGGGGSGGQRSGWLLLLGGAALAATAAAAACAATLYMQQLSENGPRQGSTRRRHRQHLRKLADERAASAGSLSYSSSSDRSSDEDEDGEGAEDNGASSSKTASRRGDERDAVDEFVRRRRRVRHVNGTATPATGPQASSNSNRRGSSAAAQDSRSAAAPPFSAARPPLQNGTRARGTSPSADRSRRSSRLPPLSEGSVHRASGEKPNGRAGHGNSPHGSKGRLTFGSPASQRNGNSQLEGDGVTLLPREDQPLRGMERIASTASIRAQPPSLPAHLLPGMLNSAPGHAPAPVHNLSTAPDLITEGQLQEEAALHEQYTRVITPEPGLNEETEDVCALLEECYLLRDKWLFRSSVQFPADEPEVANPSDLLEGRDPFEFDTSDPQTQPSEFDFEMEHGVTKVWTDSSRKTVLAETPGNSYEFFVDMHRMLAIQAMGAVRSFCFHRLELLGQKFNLHVMMNADKEFLAQKAAPHRDFYNVRKVDTHIHHSACMHQKHLLRFIKSKLRKEPDQVVIFRDGKYLTLAEVFESLKMTGHDLNVDTLDMHADKNIFHRFDKFNLKYNPCGQSRLREIFIKQDNIIHGRFLAELTQEVVVDLEASKYQHAELRISVYGRKKVEWDILAAWICQHHLYSDNVVWLIQIPRLYAVYKEQGIIETFEQMLDHIFTPLFEVTRDPTTHPQLHLFLKQVVGFDMVDDESKPERRPNKHMQVPDAWNLKHNPAYSYYAFYTYANLYTLNKFREARGLNTFTFRPHAGEAGDIDHLASAFMLCENIAHGINLRKTPVLQYLYYLKQIGLCMSPLSNNSLFLDYHRNPLPTFFARGLNVSLSTDDPLQIHLTKEPLVEEYSVAAQVWKLSATDLCEIARSSVLHSGFPHQVKMHWVHRQYWLLGPEGNDIQKTNVPNLRMRFRADTFKEELSTVLAGAAAHKLRQGARSS